MTEIGRLREEVANYGILLSYVRVDVITFHKLIAKLEEMQEEFREAKNFETSDKIRFLLQEHKPWTKP